jgi:hypothetical protein
MIAAAITQIAKELNQWLSRGLDTSEDLVVVSNLVGLDGNVVPQASERLVVFLVNIERDPTVGRGQARQVAGLGRIGTGQPALNLNLRVMFAANFSGSNYPEALKLISGTVAFFQSRPVFDHQNTPDLDRRIDRLVLDLEDLDTTDLTNLWGMLGGHYLPSVLYRVRLLQVESGHLAEQLSPVLRPAAAVRS